ncbi:MAG TPA: Ni,Fe-hydrogenase I large subunit, partial [Rhodospirillaceae bacterium]|nr:Ni,Fe-hydrogenase I large subunit [Rhodospirillaceae bacterium]
TCLHWPALLGEAPLVGPLKTLRAAFADLHRDLYPDGDWLSPGGGRLAPEPGGLNRRLEAAGEAVRLTGALGWRLRQRVAEDGLGDFGANAVEPLPELSAELLDCRLAADESFAERPDWLGVPRFTGPLARRPLFGSGLLAHLMAAEIDLAACLAEMREGIERLGRDDGQAVVLDGVSGAGLGVVEAARGRLVHRLRADQGRLGDYRTVAPTEWNFHPDGLLSQGLTGQPAPADAEFALRLLITAVDPCVDFTLTVSHA